MSRKKLIEESESLIQWLDSQIDDLELKGDARSRLAAGCLNAVLEFQKAIILLVARELPGPAFVLIRVIFEAYIKGLWLHRCASAAELEDFLNERAPKISRMLRRVEKLDGYDSGILSAAKARNWISMNNFTHTGFNLVSRYNAESTIESNFDDAEVTQVVNFANAIGCLAAIAIADVAENMELANSVLTRTKDHWPSAS